MARRRRRPNKFGSVFKRGRTWAISFYDASGIRRYKGGFASPDLAQQVLAKVVSDVQLGRAGLPADPRSFRTVAEEGDAWIERRKLTHRAWRDDQSRWKRHLRPFFGALRPADIDTARIRAFVEAKRRRDGDVDADPDRLNPSTVGHCIRLLSTMFTDFVERSRETGVSVNPVHGIPKSLRRRFRATHCPEDTPHIEDTNDVRAVFRALPEPINIAFAVGVFGMLRTGEVLGLDWRHIDFDKRVIRVCQQVQDARLGPLKDDEARTVPIQNELLPILAAWKLKTGGEGLLFRPAEEGRPSGRAGTPATFMRPNTLHKYLARVVASCGIRDVTWYQATRHTGASHWVMAGGSIEKLAAVLGHSTTEVTRRYAHLRPERFPERDRGLLAFDLGRAPADVVSLSGCYAAATPGPHDSLAAADSVNDVAVMRR